MTDEELLLEAKRGRDRLSFEDRVRLDRLKAERKPAKIPPPVPVMKVCWRCGHPLRTKVTA